MAGSDHQLEALIERIRRVRNFDFRSYKRPTLLRRIERRMAERKCRSVRAYLALLDRKPEEYDALVSSMLIKVTSFFRDPEAWQTLASKIIPDLLSRKRPGDEIRVWSAGCATGEETYSTAILFAEALGPALGNYQVKIFGTDVDEAAVAQARRGIYSPAQVEGVSRERLNRFFMPVPGGQSVRNELRRLVIFGVNNLVSDAPISRLDLLVCRNVFIYLDAELQKRVLARFHYALRGDGILFLGKSELIPFASRIFESVDIRRRLYARGGRGPIPPAGEERAAALLEQDAPRRVDASAAELLAVAHYRMQALDALPTAVIATAPDGTVTLWNGHAAGLWRRSESEVLGKKLSALALSGLPSELVGEKSAAVRERRSERVSAEGEVRVGDGPPIPIRTQVVGLPGANKGGPSGLLFAVQDLRELHGIAGKLRSASEDRQRAIEDLQTANEELQSSNEELETTNEELQSANEELQTTNEELQSTNEELETTNEELQSTNAELDATNRELAHRTEELNTLGFYQRAIIRSLSAAVIVLDPGGRITMWNLAAERLLGLTEAESIGQILWTLRIPIVSRALVKRLRHNLAQKLALREDIEYERAGGGEGHASLSAIPLADGERLLGSMVIVDDATRAAAMAEERLRELAGQRAGRRNQRQRRENAE